MSFVESLPPPLAEVAERMMAAPAGALRRDRAALFFETALRMTALAATARYLHLARHVHQNDGPAAHETRVADVLQLLGSGRLRPWLDLLHGSLEYLRAHGDEVLIPGLHTLFFGMRKPAEDALVRLHGLLLEASGAEAPPVITLERVAQLFAEARDGDQGRPAFLPQVDPELLGEQLLAAMVLLGEGLAEALPCLPASMVGQESFPTRAWLRLLTASGRPASDLVEVLPAGGVGLPPPGHLVMVCRGADEAPVDLMDLHPFAVLRDAFVWVLDGQGEEGVPRYACPGLGIVDGAAPVVPEVDFLGRYRVVRTLNEGDLVVTDLEEGGRWLLRIEAARVADPAARRERAELLRARGESLAGLPGVACARQVREAGHVIISLRPWVEGTDLVGWLEAEKRNSAELGRVLLKAARGLAAIHGSGHCHGRVGADRIIVGAEEEAGNMGAGAGSGAGAGAGAELPEPRVVLVVPLATAVAGGDAAADLRDLAESVGRAAAWVEDERRHALVSLVELLRGGVQSNAEGTAKEHATTRRLQRFTAELERTLNTWRIQDEAAAAEARRLDAERNRSWWQRLKARLRRR